MTIVSKRAMKHTADEPIAGDDDHGELEAVPASSRQPASTVFADVRGRVVYHEDIRAPTCDEWSGSGGASCDRARPSTRG